MINRNVWPIATEAMNALGEHYLPAMDQAMSEAGWKGGFWHWLFAALTFEPESVSARKLAVRTPYFAADFFTARLSAAASAGYLTPIGDQEYRLTELGRSTARKALMVAYECMATLRPLPPADLERLVSFLYRLVGASLAAPEPPGKWSITYCRRLDLTENTAFVAKADQYLSDLNSYRDDAHLAAWQPHGFTGQAWEALTFVWRGQAATLDELCQKLARRGHARSTYAEAMHDLIKRGLVEEDAGTYRMTDQGQALRQAVEDTTDRYFYAPWACLGEQEVTELQTLLARLRDGLLSPAA